MDNINAMPYAKSLFLHIAIEIKISINMPANSIPFEAVCELLENLEKNKKQRQKQEEILCNTFERFKSTIAETENASKKTLFPILRILVPDYDRERSAYYIKEQKLGKLLVNVLQLDEKSRDAKILKGTASDGRSKDIAEEAYYIIKNNITAKGKSLTVGDINDILDKIAAAASGNTREKSVQNIFTGVVKTLTAKQCKWFFRIILKDLMIGMSSTTILSCFHPDGPETYYSCKILSKLCEELSEGNNRRSIKLFNPFSPMFSARLNVTEVNQRLSLDKTSYHIETKFDGERFQMHMDNGEFKYFSRGGYDFTDSFGCSYDKGPLTSFLKDSFASEVKNFILDGEMMGWHKEEEVFGSKGMPYDVKNLSDHSTFRPCYCVFDVLYYNGKSLVGLKENGGLTLDERTKILDNMFTEIPGVLYRSKRTPVKNVEDVLHAVNAAIQDREEGIVVKDTNSYYILNNRNAGWFKVKPEYTKGSAPDLDLVIIGVSRGEVSKHGHIKSFLLACADSETPGTVADRFVCVGRVGIGLTYEEHDKLCARLRQHWKDVTKTPPPSTILFNKSKPHYWIQPQDSVIVEICATELTRSKEFASEFTLRFPRITAIRDDKPLKDVMTIREFNDLCPAKAAVSKLSTKKIELDQIDKSPKIRRKREKKELQVSADFKVPKCGEVEVISKALEGREICILSDDEDCDKLQLVRIVESHGGKVVANFGSSTWCCIAGRKLRTVLSVIESKNQDVVPTAWLRSLPPSDSLLSFRPLDALALKKETRLRMARHYDAFGDSYTELIDEDTLKRCIEKMDETEPKIYLTPQEMMDLDRQLFEDNNYLTFLRPCFIYFPNKESLNCFKAQMYGANVCNVDSPYLTHVVLPKSRDVEEIIRLKDVVDVPIVSEDWLESCFNMEMLVPETEFIL